MSHSTYFVDDVTICSRLSSYKLETMQKKLNRRVMCGPTPGKTLRYHELPFGGFLVRYSFKSRHGNLVSMDWFCPSK